MKFPLLILFTALTVTTQPVLAQESDAPVSLAVMQAARDFRHEMAVAVAQNIETEKDAIKRLREKVKESVAANSSGEADLAPLAEDIAQRLMAMERPDAAEAFFKLAEEDYEQASKQMAGNQGGKKVDYLKNLASLRLKYLGKSEQAKADLDEAIALQPDDEGLKEYRRKLAKRGQHPQSRQKN